MTTPFPFQSAAVLTAAQMNAITTLVTSTKTASHTLTIADVSTRVIMNSASATSITVNTSIFGASDVLEILNIGAGVCTVTAGTCTVGTSGSLALAQNAGGKLTFISAGVSVFQADGVTAAGGKVLQVVQASTSTSVSTTSTSFVTSGLSASITPSLATSKVLIMTNQTARQQTTATTQINTLFRGTVSGTNLATGTLFCFGISSVVATEEYNTTPMQFLDSPNTTSATTYTAGFRVDGGTATINISGTTSVMILMEIGA